jgi:hypothetical protein
MNTWNKLPASYQQRVYKNFLPIVKRQIQLAENPMPAVVISVVISVEVECVDTPILLDYLTSKGVLEQPDIGSTDPHIPTDTHCTVEQLHSGITGGCC